MRHPLTLLTNEVPALDVGSKQSVLLLQDLHAPFTDTKSGYLSARSAEKVLSREFDEYFQVLEAVGPNFSRLARAATGAGIPVLFSCLGYFPPAKPSAFQTATGWRWDLSGPAGRLPNGVHRSAPDLGPNMFAKPGWGALNNPSLHSYLRRHRIATVILAGMMLEFGIQQTAYQLQDHGFGVLIASDAVVGLTLFGASQSAGSSLHGLIKARSTAEILDRLDRLDDEGTVRV